MFASGMPSAEQAYSQDDACMLSNGSTHAMRVAAYNPAAALYRVGVRFENVQVLAERNTTNADGSARRELDVTYDEVYADGTADRAIRNTLVSGSSAGTAGCTTPSTGSNLRFLGNHRVVGFSMTPRNVYYSNYKLSDGASAATPQQVRREIRVNVSDPGQRATYAIVSGQGFASGKWKMLSPRVARDAPEMQGRVGNQNYQDGDNFRICLVPTGATYSAEAADCAGAGVGGDNGGVTASLTDAADIAAKDAQFNGWNFSADAVYTVNVYADDGWKTVNGQAGKTPIATYTTRMGALPYTLAQMAAHTTMAPRVATSSMTPAQMASAIRGAGGTATLTLDQPVAMAGESPLTTSFAYAYEHGPKVGATGAWPRVRAIKTTYPTAGNALSVEIPGQPVGAGSVTYGEVWLNGTDRNGRVIANSFTFN